MVLNVVDKAQKIKDIEHKLEETEPGAILAGGENRQHASQINQHNPEFVCMCDILACTQDARPK